jgi:predicted anti-sigma-YlaC factor YlaD
VTCDEARLDLGAYVLGALSPEEQRRLEEHLKTCADCAAEYEELRSLPALLDGLGPEDLYPAPVAPSPDLFARMSAAAALETRRPLRSRTWALVAAAVIAVLGAGVGTIVWATGSGGQTVSATAGPVEVTVTATEANDGSRLEVSVAGLRPGETCRIVAIDEDGTRHEGGSWPASHAGDGRWTGWAEVDPGSLAGAVLLGDGDRTLARVEF